MAKKKAVPKVLPIVTGQHGKGTWSINQDTKTGSFDFSGRDNYITGYLIKDAKAKTRATLNVQVQQYHSRMALTYVVPYGQHGGLTMQYDAFKAFEKFLAACEKTLKVKPTTQEVK